MPDLIQPYLCRRFREGGNNFPPASYSCTSSRSLGLDDSACSIYRHAIAHSALALGERRSWGKFVRTRRQAQVGSAWPNKTMSVKKKVTRKRNNLSKISQSATSWFSPDTGERNTCSLAWYTSLLIKKLILFGQERKTLIFFGLRLWQRVNRVLAQGPTLIGIFMGGVYSARRGGQR